MTAAVIEDGVVTNVIVVPDGYKGPHIVVGDKPVAIGDTYDGTDFYRDGVKVISEAARLAAEMDDMRQALALLGVEPAESVESEDDA